MTSKIIPYMDKIILKKNGKIEGKYWDIELEEADYQFININNENPYDITKNLDTLIQIDENYNLRDYFELFNNYDILKLLVDPYILSYLKKYNEIKHNKNNNKGDIDYISIFNVYEFEKMDNEYKIDSYCDITGFSLKESISYSISFIPLIELLDLPIKITKPLFSYQNYDKLYEKEICNNNNNKKNNLELDIINKISDDYIFKNTMTFYEFIRCLIYEISFYGDVNETKQKKIKLDKQFKESLKEENLIQIKDFNNVDELLK
jgi:hypothetical protein